MSAGADEFRDRSGAVEVSPLLMARGLAVLRIFFGVILFANGAAKLFGFSAFTIGPYRANLVNLPIARAILAGDGGRRTEVPLVNGLVNEVILPNWNVFQWVITFFELGVGALLILGLATRGAALLGLTQQLFLAAVYFSSNRWMFEQPHEYVPLLILAVIPAGRAWGLDGLLVRKDGPRLRRWPL